MKQIVTVLLLCQLTLGASAAERPPNVVLIYADDLGYGDVGCYGATKVRTPNIDAAAAAGLRFTDAHAAAATCTPSRYALLTGEYAWRKQGTGILPGDAALIIDPARPSLPSLLQQAGYATGAVGKWHLGLGNGKPDWNGDLKPGPREIGFDDSFLIPATGDRVPCVYTENGRVVGLAADDPIAVSYGRKIGDEPTGRENPELLKMKPSHGHADTIVNGISRIGFMTGGHAARWIDEDMADVITRKAVEFIDRNKSRPFFLYFATHDIHVPRVPHPRFAGKSGCGTRGDVIEEFDWCVGQVVAAIDQHGLTDDTLLIITSDNGPVVDDGYLDGSVANLNGHTPAGPLRGGKYSHYEGGTRVPFIVRWPGRIKPGVSDALICQVDLPATLAALAGATVPPGSAPDSENLLPALLGESVTGRAALVEQAGRLALRKGNWKYVPPAKKGAGELYDLKADLGETTNLADGRPETVQELDALLTAVRRRETQAD